MEYESELQGSAALAAETFGEGGLDNVTEFPATEHGTEGVAGSFFTTEAYEVPPATPKWHRGSVTGVTLLTTKTGSTGIQIGFHSDDNGRDYELVTWPPVAWIENPNITRKELAALPTAEGKKQSPLQRFGAAVHNSKGTADLDRLISAVTRSGRTLPRPNYTDINGFIEQLNSFVAGAPVIFTTREEKNDDPQYQARERVNNIYGYDFDGSKLKAYVSAAGN